MDTMTIGLIALLSVLVVLYIGRRRRRLSQED
jgi:hypothetical protein